MTRKARVDSPSEAVRIMSASGQEIQAPAHVPLDDQDAPFFASVIAEFARADWTNHAVEIAAMLARTMSTLEEEQRTLRVEGMVSVRENGTTVENPRARAVKSLTGDILSLRRSLALHARAKSGDNRDAAKQKTQGREMETDFASTLIARPGMQ